MAESTAIKPFDEQLRSQLWNNRPRYIAALDGQIEFDRFLAVALMAVRRTSKLALCTMASVMECVEKCAELGLEPGGPLGHAYLVPFKNECKLIIGYKGWLHLMFRGGGLADAEAHVVYEDDVKNGFRLVFGLETFLKHPFSFKPEKERGRKVGVYAVLRFTNGGRHVEPMSWDEVMKAKAVNQFSSDPDSPWQKWEDEQAKKTALKRAAKWSPTGRDYDLMSKAHTADFDSNVIDAAPADVVNLRTVAPPKAVPAETATSSEAIETPPEKQPELSAAAAPPASPPRPALKLEPSPVDAATAEYEAICREVYAAETLLELDRVIEKHTGWQGTERVELAARLKSRRKEIENRGKPRGAP